jgi:trimeric autotransporter adhesin
MATTTHKRGDTTVSLQQVSGVGDISLGDGTTLATLAVSTGRGPKGDGFTGGEYDASTGVVTFTSNDGIGFSTGDLRGDLSEQGPTVSRQSRLTTFSAQR